jgi:hypothetical protein
MTVSSIRVDCSVAAVTFREALPFSISWRNGPTMARESPEVRTSRVVRLRPPADNIGVKIVGVNGSHKLL